MKKVTIDINVIADKSIVIPVQYLQGVRANIVDKTIPQIKNTMSVFEPNSREYNIQKKRLEKAEIEVDLIDTIISNYFG